MSQQIKSLLAKPTSHRADRNSDCSASDPLSWLPAKVPGKAVDNGSSIWVPTSDVEDWAGIPGPLASEWSNSVVNIGGVSQRVGDFLL